MLRAGCDVRSEENRAEGGGCGGLITVGDVTSSLNRVKHSQSLFIHAFMTETDLLLSSTTDHVTVAPRAPQFNHVLRAQRGTADYLLRARAMGVPAAIDCSVGRM